MIETRILRPGDEDLVFRFLTKRDDSALLMLSNMSRVGLMREDGPYEGCYAGQIENGRLLGLVAHYWNSMLLIQAPIQAAALARLAVAQSGLPLGGFFGPKSEVAQAWAGLGMARRATRMSVVADRMVLDLDALRQPQGLQADDLGVRVRRPRSSEVDLIANWLVAFELETSNAVSTPSLRNSKWETARALIAERRLFVLERRGQLVAMAGFSGVHGETVQVGHVWTQPAHRGQGFAKTVVAGALAKIRDDGFCRATLVADDKAAKAVYKALGFVAIGKESLIYLEEEVPWRLSA